MDAPDLTPELAAKRDRLLAVLGGLPGVAVAFSGGIDSTVVAKAAFLALGPKAVAVTADSPSVARAELGDAGRLAGLIGIRHVVVRTHEFENPDYLKNDGTRCYFCKSELYSTVERLLPDLGVPVVATQVLEPGQPPRFPAGGEVVVKPVVSAGGRDTERYGPDQLAAAGHHVERLHAEGRDVLVQPYLPEIDTVGETGLVFVGDAHSHAFRKGPILRPDSTFVEGLYREEEISPRTATDAELAVAAAALDAVGRCVPGLSRADLLYARVDVAPLDGEPVVLELELVEPSLFVATDTASAARAAAAMASWPDRS